MTYPDIWALGIIGLTLIVVGVILEQRAKKPVWWWRAALMVLVVGQFVYVTMHLKGGVPGLSEIIAVFTQGTPRAIFLDATFIALAFQLAIVVAARRFPVDPKRMTLRMRWAYYGSIIATLGFLTTSITLGNLRIGLWLIAANILILLIGLYWQKHINART